MHSVWPMTLGFKSNPTKPVSLRRWVVAGVIVLVAAMAWRWSAVRRQSTVARAVASSSGRVSPAAPMSVGLSRPMVARAAKPAPAGKLAVLRTASREEVLAYAHDVLTGGGPLEDIVALLEFLVDDRPELAVDLAREIGRSEGERQVLLYATLSAWAEKDSAAALRWAFRNSAAYAVPGRASLLYIVLEQIVTNDPAAAVAATQATFRADAEAKAGPDVARFTLEALIKHGHADLAQEAIEHWSRGPDQTQLNFTDFQIVAMALATNSYAAAGSWLQSLPASPARNAAYVSFAETWARENNSEAMDWAHTLSPADGGDEIRVATFARWLKFDRQAAADWLRRHNAPDPTSERLRALLEATASE